MRYLLSLVGPLERRGALVRLVGNRNLSDVAGDLALCDPLFTLRCEEMPFIPGVDPASTTGAQQLRRRRTELFHADLNRLADKQSITDQDVLLINSLRHWSLEDVVDWLEARKPDERPILVLVLHYTPFPQQGVSDPAETSYRDAFQKITASCARERILLCTDSERLAAEYQSLFDIMIHILPIPHCPPEVKRADCSDRPLSIGFAGEARPDKGFHLLPHMVRRVQEDMPEHRLSFAFQSYGNVDAQALFPAAAAVRTLSDPLSEREYEAYIASVDIMLIPYLHGPYRAQTSGVFCEVVALGTPVLVPADTWMADQLTGSGAGLTFRAGDAEDLARACMEAIRNYPVLRDNARKAAAEWRAFHNADNYCERVGILTEGLKSGFKNS